MRFRVIALSPSDYVKWLANQKAPARNVTARSVADAAAVPHVRFASLKLETGRAFGGSPRFDADPLGEWRKMQEPAAGENAALVAEGRRLFKDKTCISCHTVRGHDGAGIVGPDLTHIGARSSVAAGALENTPERLHQWIKDPEYFKPGNKMFHGFGGMQGYMKPDDKGGTVPNIVLNDQEIDALVAYLHSLK